MLDLITAACAVASTGLQLYATTRSDGRHTGAMPTSDAPLPGLATDEELAAGYRVVRCGMCSRPLTSPEARMHGLGEGCRHKLGAGATVRRPGRFDVEQDGIPGP